MPYLSPDAKRYLVVFMEDEVYYNSFAENAREIYDRAKEKYPNYTIFAIFEIGDLVYHMNDGQGNPWWKELF